MIGYYNSFANGLLAERDESRVLSALHKFSDLSVDGYCSKDKRYWPGEDFNLRWNERFGNHLASWSLLYRLEGDSRVRDVMIDLVNDLCEFDSWNIDSSPHDDVNVMHLVIGVIYAVSSLEADVDDKFLLRVVNKLVSICRSCLENKPSSWYATTAYVHNHSFHILLLRYSASLFVESCVGRLGLDESTYSWSVETRESAKEGFDNNFLLLEKISDGSIFEGSSYASYSVFSIVQYLFFEHLRTGQKEYINSKWLGSFYQFIDSTFLRDNDIVYNIGDAPFTWAYGPEYQLFFLDWYCELEGASAKVAQEVVEAKVAWEGAREKDRNPYAFLNLWCLASLCEKNPSKSSISCPKATFNFNDAGLSHERTSSNENLYLRYGVYGGKTVSRMKSKNIGHTYPNVGDVSFFSPRGAFFTNPLYQKPKLSSLCNVLTFSSHDSAFGQDGIVETFSAGDIDRKPVSWITKPEFRYSPLVLCSSMPSYSVRCVKNNNYPEFPGDIFRFVFFFYGVGLVVVDVLEMNSAIEGLRVHSHFNNVLEKFYGEGDTVRIGNFGEISASPYESCDVVDLDLKAHEFKYNHSRVTYSRLITDRASVFHHAFSYRGAKWSPVVEYSQGCLSLSVECGEAGWTSISHDISDFIGNS